MKAWNSYDDPVGKELKVTHFEGTIKDTPELTKNFYYQKAIGHVRYSTVEKSMILLINNQCIVINTITI